MTISPLDPTTQGAQPLHPRLAMLLCGLMMAGIVINYLDRVNLGHALTPLSQAFHLSPLQEGLLLAAFSWGYVAFMVPGGMLVDRIGGVRAATISAAAWSTATLLIGLSSGLGMLLGSRILLGAAEAPIFPANARVVRESFPVHRRGLAIGVFDAGAYVGTALAAPLVVGVILLLGWRMSFVVCAGLGAAWTVIWMRWAPRLVGPQAGGRPAESGRLMTLSDAMRLLGERRILGTALAFFAYNYQKSFYLTWLPTYLVRERGIAFARVGLLGAVPPVAAIAGGICGGLFTDMLVSRLGNVTTARKVPLVLGLVLSASIVTVPWIRGTNVALCVLAFSFASVSSVAAVLWSAPSDLSASPRSVGMIGGLQNTIANVAGMVAPMVTGILIARTGTYRDAILLYAAVPLVGAAAYAVLVDSVEPLPVTRGQNPCRS